MPTRSRVVFLGVRFIRGFPPAETMQNSFGGIANCHLKKQDPGKASRFFQIFPAFAARLGCWYGYSLSDFRKKKVGRITTENKW